MQQQLETLKNITIHLAASQELSVVKSKAVVKKQLNVCTQQITTMNICWILQLHLDVMQLIDKSSEFPFRHVQRLFL